jgi:hypothetical protein
MRGVVTTQRVSTGQSDMSAQTRRISMPGRCGQKAKYIGTTAGELLTSPWM